MWIKENNRNMASREDYGCLRPRRNEINQGNEIKHEEDWHLVQRAVQGDQRARAAIVELLASPHGVLPSADDDARQAVALVITKCPEVLRGYSGACGLRAYLSTMVKNARRSVNRVDAHRSDLCCHHVHQLVKPSTIAIAPECASSRVVKAVAESLRATYFDREGRGAASRLPTACHRGLLQGTHGFAAIFVDALLGRDLGRITPSCEVQKGVIYSLKHASKARKLIAVDGVEFLLDFLHSCEEFVEHAARGAFTRADRETMASQRIFLQVPLRASRV